MKTAWSLALFLIVAVCCALPPTSALSQDSALQSLEIQNDGPFLLPPVPPDEPTGPANNFAPPLTSPALGPTTAPAPPPSPPPSSQPAFQFSADPATPGFPQPPYSPPPFAPPAHHQPTPTPAQAVSQSPPPAPVPPPALTAQPEVVPAPPVSSASTPPIVVDDPGWNLWGAKVWDPWEGNVELGLNGTDGNTETFNVRLGVTAKHKTETFVQSLQFTTIQKSANGVTTANTALLDGRLEWPMPGTPWNYFIHGLAEYDEFKAFNARVSGDTGFGYEWIQTGATTLISRTGLAFSHEIGGPDNTVHPELLLGGEYKHKFNATHSVSFKTDYYPNVQDFSDFRLNSVASWEIALAQAWGLSLKLSVIDRYDSTPQGAKPNDLDYSTLLIWTF